MDSQLDSKLDSQKSTTGCLVSGCSGRRSFLKTAVAAGIGGVAIAAPICGGAKMVLAPISQQGASGKKYPLAAVETITEVPQKFDIVDSLHDAWMTTPHQVLGSIFVVKSGDEYKAFSTVCPHAGCAISYGLQTNPNTSNKENLFYCPCHAAYFAIDGTRLDQVAPRDMDSLQTTVENGMLYVSFSHFLCGITEKKPA